MARIEAMRFSAGCNAMHLDTYEFQALPFYELTPLPGLWPVD
jgi:hypothetical protein